MSKCRYFRLTASVQPGDAVHDACAQVGGGVCNAGPNETVPPAKVVHMGVSVILGLCSCTRDTPTPGTSGSPGPTVEQRERVSFRCPR